MARFPILARSILRIVPRVIFGFPQTYPPDAVERELPDVAAARAFAGARIDPLEAVLAQRRCLIAPVGTDARTQAFLDRCDDVIRIAYARLARRHGSWGDDFHAYHNEEHILDILGDRIDRLIAARGAAVLGLRDWCALGVFAATHDLRQREAPCYAAGVGANERASLEETFRLLEAAGFSRSADGDLYHALDLMIDGSTFDARPSANGDPFNAAELVQSGGALAAKLAAKLDKHRPGWRGEPLLVHAHELALVAADIDTANVAEPFARFAASAVNLCSEREMLCGRSLDSGDSAQPVFGFLTDGQDRFFFDLHRFNSELGREAFQQAKADNAEPLKSLVMGVRARIAVRGRPATGQQVLEAYRDTLAGIV